MAFECLRGWRLHSLRGQLVPVLGHLMQTLQWKKKYAGHRHIQEEKKLQNILRCWLDSGEPPPIANYSFFRNSAKTGCTTPRLYTVDIKQGENNTFKSEGKDDIYDSFAQLMTQFLCIWGMSKNLTGMFYILKNNPVFFLNVLCYKHNFLHLHCLIFYFFFHLLFKLSQCCHNEMKDLL